MTTPSNIKNYTYSNNTNRMKKRTKINELMMTCIISETYTVFLHLYFTRHKSFLKNFCMMKYPHEVGMK